MKSGAYSIFKPAEILEDKGPTCFDQAYGMNQDELDLEHKRVNLEEVVDEVDWEENMVNEIIAPEIEKNYRLWLINANPMRDALCRGLCAEIFGNKKMVSRDIATFLDLGITAVERSVRAPIRKLEYQIKVLNGNGEFKDIDRLEYFSGKPWRKLRCTFAVKYNSCSEFLAGCIEQETNPEVKQNLQKIFEACKKSESADVSK